MKPLEISGLELSCRFYFEAVEPILHGRWPGLAYSAALIGPGSEVLGFDDAMSRDHHWGPRLLLFLAPADLESLEQEISDHLAHNLPHRFLGYPTNFSAPDPKDNGTQLLEATTEGPVRHRVEVLDLEGFLQGYLGISSVDSLAPHDWLTLPEQKLRSLTSGEVFHDGTGDVTRMRNTLRYYPRDIWLYQMAAAWARIGQEEHLMGRAGIVGDEVGSALIGGRLVRDIMRLCFLMERTYAPYPKWFGTAFHGLSCGPSLYPVLQEALAARNWREREAHLAVAYKAIAKMHNRLGITRPMPESTRRFFGRPFEVMAIQGFTESLLDRMDPAVLTETMRRSPIGGIDQISDNTDVLEDPPFRPVIARLYDA